MGNTSIHTEIEPDSDAIPASQIVQEGESDAGGWRRVYSTESAIRQPFQLFRDIVSSSWEGRELSLRFFLRNIFGSYRQTALGFLWILLPVLVQIAAWNFAAKQGVVTPDTGGMPFIIFLAISTIIWQSFFDSILSPMNAMKTNKATMTKLNFPRETLVLVGLMEVFFNLAVRVVLIGSMCLFYQVNVDVNAGGVPIEWSWMTLVAPVYMIALIFLGTAIGLVLSPIGILYEDVGNSLSIASPFWLILTPVIYRLVGETPLWHMINPPSGLLAATRDLLLFGATEMHWLALIWLLIAIPYFLVGLVWYRLSFPIVIERMAN